MRILRRLLRIIVIVTVLSALTITGLLYLRVSGDLRRDQAPGLVTDSTEVTVDDLTVTVSGTGTITPVRQVPLFFQLTAPVIEVLIAAGERVEAGQVIARLDSTDFDAAVQEAEIAVQFQEVALNALNAPPREVDLAVAEAALNAAQAAYNAAFQTGPTAQQVEIARLQAELTRNQLWQNQLQRDNGVLTLPELPPEVPPEIEALIRQSVEQFNAQNAAQFGTALGQLEYGVQIADVSAESTANRGPDLGALNGANAARTQAQIALDTLRNGPDAAQLQRAQIDLDQARLGLQQAEAAREAALLQAPFDGLVAQNTLIVGQLPPTDGPAALVIDDSAYVVDLAIDETDILDIQVGQPVDLTLDALPETRLEGVVERVATTPTRLGDLVTYLVRVRLNTTQEAVRVGMTATARIQTQQVEAVPLLLNRFIRIDRATGRAFVIVERADGDYEEVEVTLGLRNETQSQIVSGVTPGQRVVLLPRGTTLPGQGGGPGGGQTQGGG